MTRKRLFSNIQLERKVWYDFWRNIRRSGGVSRWRDDVVDPLAAKQRIINAIRKFQRDGKVCVNERSMDCDCVQGTSYRIIPATYVHYEQCLNELYSWAEGPMTTWLSSPDDPVKPEFRDLALEAFEDGHPHSASEVRYEAY